VLLVADGSGATMLARVGVSRLSDVYVKRRPSFGRRGDLTAGHQDFRY